jgi:hypothetical protein
MATNATSSIEEFVVNDVRTLHALNAILSHLPQLRRLSVKNINDMYENNAGYFPIVLNHLSYVYLEFIMLCFENFKEFAKIHFRHVEILYFSILPAFSRIIEAKQWEQFILSYMPHLRIFDYQYVLNPIYNIDGEEIVVGFKSFNSSFWSERHWFFTYEPFIVNRLGLHIILYSIQPYR